MSPVYRAHPHPRAHLVLTDYTGISAHFMDKEMESQKSKAICLGCHSNQVNALECRPVTANIFLLLFLPMKETRMHTHTHIPESLLLNPEYPEEKLLVLPAASIAYH